jgi:membrane protein implicated in regulation of membrane protease activity
MNPVVKYTLARIALFAVCVGLVSLPAGMNYLVKLLIALLVSAVASFFLLRQWRDEVAEYLSAASRRRLEQKERLRAALAGEDEQPAQTQ